MVRNYTSAQLLNRVKSLDSYKIIPKDHWLLAVRSNEDLFNTFDDKIYMFKGEKFVLVTSCTTNPGGPSLLGGWRKYNKNGAAIIKSDEWYYAGYKYGLHNGRMPALRQVSAFKYYRDNDNDKKAEETGKIFEGIFNTNLHFNSYSLFDGVTLPIKNLIGGWSHGCVVCNNKSHYENIITTTKNQPHVSFVLINEF